MNVFFIISKSSYSKRSVLSCNKIFILIYICILCTVYRERRGVLANLALGFKYHDLLPIVKYTEEENKTWGLVYDKLQATQKKYACAEYLTILPLMESECGYCRDVIPQVRVKFPNVSPKKNNSFRRPYGR